MKLTISLRRCSILALSPGIGDWPTGGAASGDDVRWSQVVAETKETESFCWRWSKNRQQE